MGVAHVQLSAFDEAIADFQAAMVIDPSDAQIHYDLGLAYKFKDRVNDAIAELTRAGELDPTLQDPPYTLGILYMQIGKLDLAAVELKKAVALRPDNGDAWAILGSTLKQDSRSTRPGMRWKGRSTLAWSARSARHIGGCAGRPGQHSRHSCRCQ